MDEVTKFTIKNTGGRTHTIIVDGDYDGEFLSGLKYYLRVLPSGYVQLSNVYRRQHPDAPLYLHQLVLKPRKGYWTHFKNGNRLDCRSSNLEYVTPSTTCKNRKQSNYRDRDSVKQPYRGISRPSGGLWYVHIRGEYARDKDGKILSFKDPKDAARAYDIKAREYWGNKATLNFPKEITQ